MRTKGSKERDDSGGKGSEGRAGDGVVRVAMATAMGKGSHGEVRAKSREARATVVRGGGDGPMAASTRWRLNSNSGG